MKIITLLLSFALTIIVASSAHAASQWQNGYGYKVRILNAGMAHDGNFHMGIHIKLEDGWKTYWRAPGDSGIPPKLSFKQSQNLKDVKIHWPAPDVFPDHHGTSIGYKGDVVLPVVVTPKIKDKPLHLHLSLFFGVCEEICVPAEEVIEKEVKHKADTSGDVTMIKKAMAEVPDTWTTKASETVAHLIDVDFASSAKSENLILSLHPHHDMRDVKVLVEGPRDWFFEPVMLPFVPKANEDKAQTISVPIHRIIREELTGDEEVRVTVISKKHALEKTVALR